MCRCVHLQPALPRPVLPRRIRTAHNNRRTYDPVTGRYLESDPIGLRGGSYSTYNYVGADPVTFSDPFGLCAAGTHPATPDEIAKILSEAGKIQKQGLSHAQIQCNQFVDRAINAAFPGALSQDFNTTQLSAGQGLFQPSIAPQVGDLAVLTDPGHVVFVTGVGYSSEGQSGCKIEI
jgi:hypothetical protein